MEPIMLQSATGIGSPLRIEVREDTGAVWIESWATEHTTRAWSNPKLDDLLNALGVVRRPRTVTTAAELDALPVGSVVLVADRKCADECAWQLFDDVNELRDEFGYKARQAWGSAAYIHEMSSADLFTLGTVTVLHEAAA